MQFTSAMRCSEKARAPSTSTTCSALDQSSTFKSVPTPVTQANVLTLRMHLSDAVETVSDRNYVPVKFVVFPY